jgi:hypothetical protein
MMLNKNDLCALRGMIAEARTILITTNLPQGRAERALELLESAVESDRDSDSRRILGPEGRQGDGEARAGVLRQDRGYAKDEGRRQARKDITQGPA